MTLTIDITREAESSLKEESQRTGVPMPILASRLLTERLQPNLKTNPVHTSDNVLHKRPNLGFAAGRGIWISDDFDEPLEEFKEYM